MREIWLVFHREFLERVAAAVEILALYPAVHRREQLRLDPDHLDVLADRVALLA